ncbi:hypothetical protein FWC63_01100 [Candidatus Saccharibacteria bacterium]|nr:hypothetical protein [Candidatus Saccharibacteria bacterium]
MIFEATLKEIIMALEAGDCEKVQKEIVPRLAKILPMFPEKIHDIRNLVRVGDDSERHAAILILSDRSILQTVIARFHGDSVRTALADAFITDPHPWCAGNAVLAMRGVYSIKYENSYVQMNVVLQEVFGARIQAEQQRIAELNEDDLTEVDGLWSTAALARDIPDLFKWPVVNLLAEMFDVYL